MQFYFVVSGMNILGHGIPDNNLESPCIIRAFAGRGQRKTKVLSMCYARFESVPNKYKPEAPTLKPLSSLLAKILEKVNRGYIRLHR
jgi:hypothetical protein